MTDLNKIVEFIEHLNENTVIIYIAVGSAMNDTNYYDSSGCLNIPESNDQQFPLFLKNMKAINPQFPTHVILIDELLEKPPSVVCNKNKQKQDEYEMSLIGNTEHYYNQNINTHVYAIREYVTYEPYTSEKNYNITKTLEHLNKLAMQHNWFVVFQDYCGKYVGLLAQHFDELLKGHLDHIVYGIAAREDFSCYIDLTLPVCQFDFKVDSGKITVFNPYNYNYTQLKEMHNDFINGKTVSDIVKEQINTKLKMITEKIKNTIIPLVRLSGLTTRKSIFHIDALQHYCNIIEKKYNIQLFDFVMEEKYDDFFNVVLCIFKSEVYEYNEPAIVELIISNMLEIDDEYKWSECMQKLCPVALFDNEKLTY